MNEHKSNVLLGTFRVRKCCTPVSRKRFCKMKTRKLDSSRHMLEAFRGFPKYFKGIATGTAVRWLIFYVISIAEHSSHKGSRKS